MQNNLLLNIKQILFLLVSLLLINAVLIDTSTSGVAIYLVGDSTMSEKEVRAYPETGWGTPFADYFVDEVRVENHARNGRSSRTFLEEGR